MGAAHATTGDQPPAPPCQDGTTGLYMAAQEGHEAVVRLLLEHRADANAATQVPLAGGRGVQGRCGGRIGGGGGVSDAATVGRSGSQGPEETRPDGGCERFDQWIRVGPVVRV